MKKVFEVASLILVGTHILVLIAFYSELPSEIAVHYDFDGKADSFGGKDTLWFLLGINIFVYSILSLIPFSPNRWGTIEQSEQAKQKQFFQELMAALKLLTSTVFTGISISSILLGSGLGVEGFARWIVPSLLWLIVIALVGIAYRYYPKLK